MGEESLLASRIMKLSWSKEVTERRKGRGGGRGTALRTLLNCWWQRTGRSSPGQAAPQRNLNPSQLHISTPEARGAGHPGVVRGRAPAGTTWARSEAKSGRAGQPSGLGRSGCVPILQDWSRSPVGKSGPASVPGRRGASAFTSPKLVSGLRALERGGEADSAAAAALRLSHKQSLEQTPTPRKEAGPKVELLNYA